MTIYSSTLQCSLEVGRDCGFRPCGPFENSTVSAAFGVRARLGLSTWNCLGQTLAEGCRRWRVGFMVSWASICSYTVFLQEQPKIWSIRIMEQDSPKNSFFYDLIICRVQVDGRVPISIGTFI